VSPGAGAAVRQPNEQRRMLKVDSFGRATSSRFQP